MSWEERDYADDPWRKLGKPGGDWQGLRPTLDNPFSWAVSLFRVSGITVRIHLLFIVYIVVELLRALAGPGQDEAEPLGVGIVALVMAALFAVVLLHEFGHCIACRRAGGTADEILMWPLGGLARCHSGNNWRRHLITAVGGPMVNVVICVVLGITLGAVTGQWLGVALPNPIYPLNGLFEPEIGRSWMMMALLCVHAVSYILLLFNLLPMFPLDGGQILQSLLWPKFGYANSMRFAVRTGFVGAIALAIFGLVIYDLMLVCIAIFGGVTCYITHKQLEFTQGMMGGATEEYAVSVLLDDAQGEAEPAPPTRVERRAEKQQQAAEDEQRRVDAILAKIAESGMDSLTVREKKLLKRVTDRKRQGEL